MKKLFYLILSLLYSNIVLGQPDSGEPTGDPDAGVPISDWSIVMVIVGILLGVIVYFINYKKSVAKNPT